MKIGSHGYNVLLDMRDTFVRDAVSFSGLSLTCRKKCVGPVSWHERVSLLDHGKCSFGEILLGSARSPNRRALCDQIAAVHSGGKILFISSPFIWDGTSGRVLREMNQLGTPRRKRLLNLLPKRMHIGPSCIALGSSTDFPTADRALIRKVH